MASVEAEVAERCAALLWPQCGFERAIGLTLEGVGPGFSKMTIKVTPEGLNFYGGAHGGLLFAAADSAFALACNSFGYVTVASGCSIEYLRPVTEGETLTVSCNLITKSGKSGLYSVDITNAKKEIVARFQGRSHQTIKLIIPPSSEERGTIHG